MLALYTFRRKETKIRRRYRRIVPYIFYNNYSFVVVLIAC